MVQTLWKSFLQFLIIICHNHMTQQSHSRNSSKTNENICPHQDLYMNVYSSLIHNHPKLEITQTAIRKGVDKLVHPCNGILLRNKKEGADTQDNIDEPQIC